MLSLPPLPAPLDQGQAHRLPARHLRAGHHRYGLRHLRHVAYRRQGPNHRILLRTESECSGDAAVREKLSAVQQPELIAKGLEQAFHLMWQRWCDDLPPISLDVSDIQMNTVLVLES